MIPALKKFLTPRGLRTDILGYKNEFRMIPEYEQIAALPHNPARFAEGGIRMSPECDPSRGQRLAADDYSVTIITAVFNGIKTVEKSIASVLENRHENIEYLVIDGGSTDGTVDILRKYSYCIDYWVSEPDDGIYDAWNKAIRLASGNWIAFVGADDVIRSGAIHQYLEYIKQNKKRRLDFVSSKINLVANGLSRRVVGRPWEWHIFKKYMGVAHVGALHHRSLFMKFGLYDISYKICGDYELLLRARKALRADFLDVVTVDMEVGGASSSQKSTFDEVMRAKITTAGRSMVVCKIERLLALSRWYLRKLVRGY